MDEMDEFVRLSGEDEADDDAVWAEDDSEMDEMDGILETGVKDEADDDDDERVGDSDAGVVELEGVLEELELNGGPAARISMLPWAKI
jgi:hypothetical protein